MIAMIRNILRYDILTYELCF
eukprot:SAG11_NODE_36691_length_260_cov_0.950311_1_plen_20_part_01